MRSWGGGGKSLSGKPCTSRNIRAKTITGTAKVEKKGRTKEELHQVITWLTGYNENKLQILIQETVTFEQFFKEAAVNPNAHLITGVICGYRVEEIENPLTRQVRYLDKLVDELAKGRKLEKILRMA